MFPRPPGTLSRRQVARLLSVSEAHVCKALDGTTLGGITLSPSRGEGRVWYEQAMVVAFAKHFERKRPPARTKRVTNADKIRHGLLAARVFKLLGAGASFAAIVTETEGDPHTIRRLWREYHTSFEQGEAQKKQEELAELQRKAAKSLERERSRDAYFARKASQRSGPTPSALSLLQQSRIAPPAPPPPKEEKSA